MINEVQKRKETKLRYANDKIKGRKSVEIKIVELIFVSFLRTDGAWSDSCG